MNRRNFIGMMVGGVAAAAAVRTWPFRVYSFPSEPRIAFPDFRVIQYTVTWVNKNGLELEAHAGAQRAYNFWRRFALDLSPIET